MASAGQRFCGTDPAAHADHLVYSGPALGLAKDQAGAAEDPTEVAVAAAVLAPAELEVGVYPLWMPGRAGCLAQRARRWRSPRCAGVG
jgi:hypothetical protein